MLYDIDHSLVSTWQDVSKQVPAITRITQSGKSKVSNFEQLESELFTRLFNGDTTPMSTTVLSDELWLAKLHNALGDTKSWSDLVSKTQGNKRLSMVATSWILNAVDGNLPKFEGQDDLSKLRASKQQAQKLGIRSLVTNLDTRIAEGDRLARDYSDKLDVKRWPSQATSDALAILTSNMAASSGWHDLPGVHNAKSLADQVKATQAYSGDRAQKILLQLGRMSSTLGKTRTTATKKTSGIEYGNSIPDLLPEEWLKSEDQFLLEYAEEKLAQTSRGKATMGKGPIIVLLDQSGSMDNDCLEGSKSTYDIWAKAFTLLTAKIARQEKREVFCITFDGYIRDKVDLTSASSSQVSKVLNSYPNGGTEWTVAINQAVEILKGKSDTKTQKFKSSDVLLITDGVSIVSDTYQQNLKELKLKLNFKIQSILISNDDSEDGTYSPLRLLKGVSDDIVRVGSLVDESKLKSVVSSL